MPRKYTPDEIQNQKDLMYQKGIELIKDKGVVNLTLNEIIDANQIAKGTFYRYYKSKEEFLYEVIKRNEKYYFDIMMQEGKKQKKSKMNIINVFNKSFLDENCLFAYTGTEDIYYLFRHLPPNMIEKEMQKSQGNYQSFSDLLGLTITEENYGTLSYLMDGLQSILRNPAKYGETGRKTAAQRLVYTIAEYLMEACNE